MVVLFVPFAYDGDGDPAVTHYRTSTDHLSGSLGSHESVGIAMPFRHEADLYQKRFIPRYFMSGGG